MAELKITQLPEDTFAEMSDSDVMPIVNQVAGETRKITLFELDKRWRALPAGGTANQVLAKLSGVDGEVTWVTLTKASVGLGQVNNTADIDKPLSQAMIDALNTKATNTSVASKANKTYVDDQLALKQDLLPTPAGENGKVLQVAGDNYVLDLPPDGVAVVKYFGLPTVDGTWRFRVDSGNMVLEKRISGSWEQAAMFPDPSL